MKVYHVWGKIYALSISGSLGRLITTITWTKHLMKLKNPSKVLDLGAVQLDSAKSCQNYESCDKFNIQSRLEKKH